jgi:hypothetical protein
MPKKVLLTLRCVVRRVEQPKRRRWAAVSIEAVVTTVAPDPSLTPFAAVVARLAKFLSNHGWTRTANLLNQSIATTVSNKIIPDKKFGIVQRRPP